MSLFGSLLEKLGLGTAAAAPKPVAAPPATTPATHLPSPAVPAAKVPAANKAIAVVDVVAQLEKLAAASPQKLNWRTSIVDLLKLLDMDSSFAARKAMAVELGCPADFMADSAKMNTWLHKAVLQQLADHGGNIPIELLD
ncbi:MAG: DUF3597 domain-containing protein [Pseudomonadota bacterium]